MARVAGAVVVCMWGVEEVQMFAAIGRTAQAVGGGYAEQGARRYRTPDELRDLLVGAGLEDVKMGELDVTASYTGCDDFWSALGRQVGPAGAWLQSLQGEQRDRAHDELHRQLGAPAGPFTLNGRAFGARATRA
jgi:hypothetical protein